MTAAALKQQPIERMDSADVQSCIQHHFGAGGEKYAVLFEVRNGTGWRANRSVDAVVMGLWPSLGLHLTGMEIKVHRSDWLRECKAPAKASEVFDYFDYWYLVAPEDVAKPEELPTPWGWYAPHKSGLRIVREAAKNPNVKPVDRHFLAALLRRVAKTDDAFVSGAVSKALEDYRRQMNDEIDQRSMQRLGDLRKDAEQWAKLRDLLKNKPDDYVYQPDVVEALRILVKAGIGKSYSSLRSLLNEVKRNHDALSAIAGDLGVEIEEPKKAKRR